MSISYDELIKQAREQDENFEIPDGMLEAIAGGISEEDNKAAIKFISTVYKACKLPLDEAIAIERDSWHRTQAELDYMREIWDSIQ